MTTFLIVTNGRGPTSSDAAVPQKICHPLRIGTYRLHLVGSIHGKYPALSVGAGYKAELANHGLPDVQRTSL